MLTFHSVRHDYGGHRVLDGVDLTVPRGQLLSLVGPSGCGKSTLLRCAAGLLRPAGGHVTVDGAEVDGVPERLAVVFQDYSRSLFPWLSVRDNVALPLRRTALARDERRERAAGMLERVGLGGSGRRYPWQLSGGMQQRVALARALVCEPALLLMDEPFGSLDAGAREELEDLLLSVHANSDATILLVTHDIDESVYVGDRVVVLTPSPGRVRADLPVELPAVRDQVATRQDPAFVALRARAGAAVRGLDPATGRTDAADQGLQENPENFTGPR
ncbi:ABC transporter ATP-binding protein [Streptomyces sp. HNM0574]|uniref:ATP-binding cassette domain-containing protein n=1 Tax=Streptomyces sp. HNM0574 TaxID=2714954 RepID=UPI00146A58B2|nr:ABC transporter ATP-binding protein [Streptomyces sp. HNM0574]